MTTTLDLTAALEHAHRALAILEEQAAGYTVLTIPVHLKLDLEAKRREVVELEARLNGSATAAAPPTPSTSAFNPAWSPLGDQIAFANDGNGDGWLEIWLINSNGSNAKLRYSPMNNMDLHTPAWAPDGKWLAYIQTAWIYYQGNWYWTDSNLFLADTTLGYSGSISPIQDDRIWSVDWASTDTTPPDSCTLLPPGPSVRWSSFPINLLAQDIEAGVASYDVQLRQAGSTWQEVASKVQTGIVIESSYNGVVEFRCRARDFAGNVADWPASGTMFLVDGARPTSQVVITERTIKGMQIPVIWSGTDKGIGIAGYDIFVRDGVGGDWELWLQDVTTTTGIYQGNIGHTYFFRSQAWDQVGHQEVWQPAPKAAVTLYAHAVTGTVRDHRGSVVLATPQIGSSLYSSINALTGMCGLYLGAQGIYTLEVHADGFGDFPLTPLGLTKDITFDLVLPPASNAITNGGFESGTLSGWSTVGAEASVTATARYAGSYALQLRTAMSDTVKVSQPIDVALHEPTLSFLYLMPEALADGAFTVEIVGTVTTQVFSTSVATDDWQHAWVDLSPYAGQNVTLTFELRDASGAVGLDEVSVGSWDTPQIHSLSPTVLFGQATSLILTGTNFLSTPTVYVGNLPLTQVTWISATQVSVVVPANLPVGVYLLRVVNPGGAATQSAASFMITRHAVWLPLILKPSQVPAFEDTPDWLTLGGNPGRTGYRPLEADASRYTQVWTTTLPYPGGRCLAQVAVADGVLVASSDTNFKPSAVVALDAHTGQELWRRTFTNKFSLNPPAIGHGMVYVQQGNHGSDSYLFCWDLYTGEKKWQAPFSAQWETYLAPLVVGQGVYVNGGYYGGMYGFNAGNGAQLWFTELEQYDAWTPSYLAGKLYSRAAGLFREHDLATGQILWSVNAAWFWSCPINTAPVVDQRTALVASSGGLTAIDLDSRTASWVISGNYKATLPAIAGDVVCALKEGVLEVRCLADGELLWSFEGEHALINAPIVTANYIYVASAETTYVLSRATHVPLWQANHGGWLTVANGYLYIAQADKTIYAYRAQEP